MMSGLSLVGLRGPTYSPLFGCRSEPPMHAIVILTSIASSSTSGSAYSRGSSGVSIAVQTIALPVFAMSLSLHVIQEVYRYHLLHHMRSPIARRRAISSCRIPCGEYAHEQSTAQRKSRH